MGFWRSCDPTTVAPKCARVCLLKWISLYESVTTIRAPQTTFNICGLHVDDLSLLLYLGFRLLKAIMCWSLLYTAGINIKGKANGINYLLWLLILLRKEGLKPSTEHDSTPSTRFNGHCPAGQERCQCHDEGLGGISAPWPNKNLVGNGWTWHHSGGVKK